MDNLVILDLIYSLIHIVYEQWRSALEGNKLQRQNN